MAEGIWNRSSRRSGGHRPGKIILPSLTAEDILIMHQREQIRAEFGQVGVERFGALLLLKTQGEVSEENV